MIINNKGDKQIQSIRDFNVCVYVGMCVYVCVGGVCVCVWGVCVGVCGCICV